MSNLQVVETAREGASFCVGGDFKLLQAQCDPWPVRKRFRGLSRWLLPWMKLDKPVRVGVRGHAVGGVMGLALTADAVIADARAESMRRRDRRCAAQPARWRVANVTKRLSSDTPMHNYEGKM